MIPFNLRNNDEVAAILLPILETWRLRYSLYTAHLQLVSDGAEFDPWIHWLQSQTGNLCTFCLPGTIFFTSAPNTLLRSGSTQKLSHLGSHHAWAVPEWAGSQPEGRDAGCASARFGSFVECCPVWKPARSSEFSQPTRPLQTGALEMCLLFRAWALSLTMGDGFPHLRPPSLPIWECRERLMSLNMRDGSAGSTELSAGLVKEGRGGNGTRHSGKCSVRILWFPTWMAFGCIWFDIKVQIQLLSYSRQETSFSL